LGDLLNLPGDDAQVEGPETRPLTLFDTGSSDAAAPSVATVTIADNDPPNTSIDSRPLAPTSSSSAFFTFSGSEPASAIGSYACALDGAAFSVCTSPATYGNLAEGLHTFSVRAVDRDGHSDPTPASFSWTVDFTAPSITVSVSQATLWPANGKMVAETVTGRVTDVLSGVDPASVAFDVVDYYGRIRPTGPVILDPDGRFTFSVSLEASRLGQDSAGRTYRVIVSAADRAGNSASASAVVNVPHDLGRGAAPLSRYTVR
jgi:hypothetical protein